MKDGLHFAVTFRVALFSFYTGSCSCFGETGEASKIVVGVDVARAASFVD